MQVLLDYWHRQPPKDSILAQQVRTWIVELKQHSPDAAILRGLKSVEWDDSVVKIRRLGTPSNGGRFYYITDVVRHAIQLAASSRNLVQGDMPFTDLETIEFCDGTEVCAHSVTGGRIRLLSETMFQSSFLNPDEQQPYTKLLRLWDMVCGEGQAFQGPKMIVLEEHKQELNSLFALMLPEDFTWSTTLTTADLRALTMVYLDWYELSQETCGGSIPFAASVQRRNNWFIADGKGVDEISGMEGKRCGSCTLNREEMENDLYTGTLRSQGFNHTEYQGLLKDLASLSAYASGDPEHKAECTRTSTMPPF
ncbi:hypothetical protein CYMTET_25615 [Cymbomonas tetramitiformis]|uniref:Uncharacterized protein n=1 Tax=Cymbomonas tetramitiformis TaxID=36881 RepID=A0AAE0KZ13_9CHLO|nr:hypothetical protein CYMTET_25615 [Cymbomonas tetramitiformis]